MHVHAGSCPICGHDVKATDANRPDDQEGRSYVRCPRCDYAFEPA